MIFFQYGIEDRAHRHFHQFNITINSLLNRIYFRRMLWKWNSIDNQFFNNISSNCFSIGYYFQDDYLEDFYISHIFLTLTVNTNCFNKTYNVSVIIIYNL